MGGLLLVVALFAAVPVGIAVLFAWWARALVRRGGPEFARWIPGALAGMLPLVFLVALGIGVYAHWVAARSPGVDPALRSKILADGIAEGLNFAVFYILVLLAAAFLALVTAQLLAWRRAKRS